MPTLLCLHGWGGSSASFTELRDALHGSGLHVLTPDLPGFGEEPEPSQPWTVDAYADWVEEYLRAQNIHGPLLLLGHSHGGRISIKLAARGKLPLQHLYLCAAAGIWHPRHLKRAIGLILAKTGKGILSIPGMRSLQPIGKKMLYRLVRVHDYESASPIMRATLHLVSREDLRSLLPCIKVPTDLFWGDADTLTPLADGQLMEATIPQSTLHVYAGVRHRVHRDRAAEIATIIRQSL